MTDTRYPYTYACDLIRSFVGPGLSRSHAAQIRQGIAEAIGMEDSELAGKLADHYLKTDLSVDEVMRQIGAIDGD